MKTPATESQEDFLNYQVLCKRQVNVVPVIATHEINVGVPQGSSTALPYFCSISMICLRTYSVPQQIYIWMTQQFRGAPPHLTAPLH